MCRRRCSARVRACVHVQIASTGLFAIVYFSTLDTNTHAVWEFKSDFTCNFLFFDREQSARAKTRNKHARLFGNHVLGVLR